MSPSEAIDAGAFEVEAKGLLESIREARDDLEDVPGVLDGEFDRFRDRIDRMIRESEVDNWRQVRIFLRDVDSIAADLAKAARDRKLSPKHVHVLDLSLRKARKRDFYGSRKAWRKLDKVADQIAELRGLHARYREAYRAAEGRSRHLRAEIERLGKVPKPSASAAEAASLIADVDAFNEAAEAAYLDFLARTPAHLAIPLLLGVGQGGGIGVPAPPRGADPEPLLSLLGDADPAREGVRGRSFYGLLELPGYSDAKLAHLMGDARVVRRALDAAWVWLKAIRDDERRSLRIQWTDDGTVLRRRLSALLDFLRKLNPPNDAVGRGEVLLASLVSGRFAELQAASRLYASHGKDAERKWRGEIEKDIEVMRGELRELTAVLKALPDPTKVEAGEA